MKIGPCLFCGKIVDEEYPVVCSVEGPLWVNVKPICTECVIPYHNNKRRRRG